MTDQETLKQQAENNPEKYQATFYPNGSIKQFVEKDEYIQYHSGANPNKSPYTRRIIDFYDNGSKRLERVWTPQRRGRNEFIKQSRYSQFEKGEEVLRETSDSQSTDTFNYKTGVKTVKTKTEETTAPISITNKITNNKKSQILMSQQEIIKGKGFKLVGRSASGTKVWYNDVTKKTIASNTKPSEKVLRSVYRTDKGLKILETPVEKKKLTNFDITGAKFNPVVQNKTNNILSDDLLNTTVKTSFFSSKQETINFSPVDSLNYYFPVKPNINLKVNPVNSVEATKNTIFNVPLKQGTINNTSPQAFIEPKINDKKILYDVKNMDKSLLMASVDTSLKTSKAKAVLKEGIPITRPSTIILSKITGNKIKADAASSLIGEYDAKRSLNQGTITAKDRQDYKVFEELKGELQKQTTKGTLIEQGNIAASTLTVFGVGKAATLATKIPAVNKVITKPFVTKGLSVSGKVLKYAYFGTETYNIVDSFDKMNSGNFETGAAKLSDVTGRLVGFNLGARLLSISSIPKADTVFSGVKNSQFNNFNSVSKFKIPTKQDYYINIDRYNNLYLTQKHLVNAGQTTLTGSKADMRPIGLSSSGKISITKNSPYELMKNIKLTQYKVYANRLRFDNKNNIIGLKDVNPTKQTRLADYKQGTERYLSLDTKTSEYFEFTPKDIRVNKGQVQIKQSGSWKPASDFKGIIKTDMSLKEFTSRRLNDVSINIKDLSKQKSLDSFLPKTKGKPTTKSEFIKALEKNIDKNNINNLFKNEILTNKNALILLDKPKTKASLKSKTKPFSYLEYLTQYKGIAMVKPVYTQTPSIPTTKKTIKIKTASSKANIKSLDAQIKQSTFKYVAVRKTNKPSVNYITIKKSKELTKNNIITSKEKIVNLTFKESKPSNKSINKIIPKIIIKQSNKSNINIKQLITPNIKQNTNSNIRSEQIITPITEQFIINNIKGKSKTDSKSLIKIDTVSNQTSNNKTTQQQKQDLFNIPLFINTKPTFKPKETIKPKPPKPFFFSFSLPNFNSNNYSFDVFVRRRGKFKKVNSGLSKSDALGFGGFFVDTTSAATFKIKKSGKSVSKSFNKVFDKANFYQKDNLYIEKRSKRISTGGEKKEITLKGLQTISTKKILGGLKNVF